MHIKFSPQRSDLKLKIMKLGDTLTINGKAFDFSVIPDGGILPAEGVESEFVVGQVRREGGELQVTLLLPHGVNPPDSVSFPEPLINPPEGALALPTDEMEISANG